MGGVQDLLRQDPRDGRVPEMGSHVSTRVAVHLRPRQKLQQLRGAHEHDSQGEETTAGLLSSLPAASINCQHFVCRHEAHLDI